MNEVVDSRPIVAACYDFNVVVIGTRHPQRSHRIASALVKLLEPQPNPNSDEVLESSKKKTAKDFKRK